MIMPVTCSSCGNTNPDGASFCMSCGSRLQGAQAYTNWQSQPVVQSQPPVQAQQGVPPAAQSGQPSNPTPLVSYVAQLQPGKHKHMLTDIGFKDASGSQVMVAQKHSLLGFEYDILDSYGNLMGHVKQHAMSIHNTFDATGTQHELVGRVKHQLLGSMVFQDNFWFEDGNAQRFATVTGDAFNSQFVLQSAVSGSTIATVKLDFPGGFIRNVQAFSVGRYQVQVYSSELSSLMLAAFLVALEHRRETQRAL